MSSTAGYQKTQRKCVTGNSSPHCPAADWLTFAQHKPAYMDTADIFAIITVTLRINIITLMSFCSDEGLCAETSTLISLCCCIRLFYRPAVHLFIVVLLCIFLWSLSIFLKLDFSLFCVHRHVKGDQFVFESFFCLFDTIVYFLTVIFPSLFF